MEPSQSQSSDVPSSPKKTTYDVAFRQAEEKDVPYIKDSYAESYKDAPASRHIHAPIYKKGARRTIDALRERAECWVVTPPKYPDLLLGWAIVERAQSGACVHYVYVKKAYRRAGVCTSLVSFLFDLLKLDPEADVRFSHWRQPAGKLARKRGWRFDPYLILEPPDEAQVSQLR